MEPLRDVTIFSGRWQDFVVGGAAWAAVLVCLGLVVYGGARGSLWAVVVGWAGFAIGFVVLLLLSRQGGPLW